MKTNPHPTNREDPTFALWFAIFSPLIGIVIGLLGLFAFAR
jgi:predicted membrane protein